MNSVQDIIKAVASSLHQRHLKPRGFQKSGNTWIREVEWPQVLNIQLSKWNTSTEANFTVNLGISIEALHTASEGLPLKGTIKEYDCDVRSRIGQLIPGDKDRWWEVSLKSDEDTLTDEVYAALVDYGFPWFERLTNFSAVASEYATRNMPFMAALAYHLGGDKAAAEKCMAKAYCEANIHFLPKLKRLAQTHGIPVPG